MSNLVRTEHFFPVLSCLVPHILRLLLLGAMSTTNIDDQDPSVKYVGNWVPGGHPPEYNDTVTSSTHVGDYFTVPFTGTSISVVGTMDSTSHGVVTSYTIDGAAPAQVTTGTASGDTYNQTFWSSPSLSPGAHTLQVTLVAVNTAPNLGSGEGTLWFDYFAVGHDISSSISTASQSSSPSSTAAGHKNTATNSKSSAPADSSSTSPAKNQSTGSSNTGAIVGAIIAVVVIILALVAFFLCYRHRKNRAKNGSSDSFEKFFNNPPHASAPAQNPTPPIPSTAMAMNHPVSYNAPPRAAYPAPTRPHGYTPVAASPLPSEDSTSVTSSNVVPPSKQFMYAHNNDNVLTYNPTPIASSFSRPPTATSSTSTPYDGDSVAELKRRQQEAIANYNAGLAQGGVQPQQQYVQHVDSGIRGPAPSVELPPVYSAT